MNANEQALAALVKQILDDPAITPKIQWKWKAEEVLSALESGGAEGGEAVPRYDIWAERHYDTAVWEYASSETGDWVRWEDVERRLTQAPQVPVSGYSQEQLELMWGHGRRGVSLADALETVEVQLPPPAKIDAPGVVSKIEAELSEVAAQMRDFAGDFQDGSEEEGKINEWADILEHPNSRICNLLRELKAPTGQTGNAGVGESGESSRRLFAHIRARATISKKAISEAFHGANIGALEREEYDFDDGFEAIHDLQLPVYLGPHPTRYRAYVRQTDLSTYTDMREHALGEWVKFADLPHEPSGLEGVVEDLLDHIDLVGHRKDHACRQCVGDATISEDFVCAYHRAKAALKSKPSAGEAR